jgi:pSer/pThr/pTyr-binding forkhead associated (FHA) protein
MHAYIHHRLEVAGAADRQIFAEDTYPEIFRYTGGVPRLVNTLCDTAMLAAFGAERDTVTLNDIQESLAELRWHEPQNRARTGSTVPADSGSNGGGSANEYVDTATHVGEPVGRIIVATEGRTTQELPLAVGRVIVGRTSDNDLQIDSRFVSRHHCQIITGADGSVIEDLNSTNGIFVQGKRVRRYNLNDGDIVVIGKHELMYVDERLARARLHSTDSAAEYPPLQPPADRHTESIIETSAQMIDRLSGR